MNERLLGRTGLSVSAVGPGAGPVPGGMNGGAGGRRQQGVARGPAPGITGIDTAPGYGDGRSEANLGRALRALGARDRVHVATKVRLAPEDLTDAGAAVRRSLEGSLSRLGLPAVTLLQLHNGITARRGDVPASLTPEDVLGPGGVRAAFERVRAEGLVRFVGLTGTGDPG